MSERAIDLTRVPVQALEQLRDELARSRAPELTEALIASAAGQPYVGALRPLCEIPAVAVLALLGAVIAERRCDRAPQLQLVWTGPEASVSHSRSNAVVVRELFEGAAASVLIGGYAFDHGERIFEPLRRAMSERGVSVEIFLDLRGDAKPGVSAHAFASVCVDRFFRENWPFDGARPVVYYAPITAVRGASLHAKCVVVDARRALVTSANFTDRGQTRNLELGVLIQDRVFAELLVAQWRGLVAQGIVVRYEG